MHIQPTSSPPSVDIRLARLDDAQELAALAAKTYADTFGSEFEPGELQRYLESTVSAARWLDYLTHDRVFLALQNGVAVGYVQFGPGEVAGGVEIRRLYVDKAMHGVGVGTALLATVLADGMVRQSTNIRIEVWENNHGARRLYERFGFRHEGEMKPFVSETGMIEGYDLVLRLRQ